MLTRDIELSDAILDLVDNCVDGAARQTKKKKKSDRQYEGFEANLRLSSAAFEIWDNCGGIPNERIEDAFLLGRPKIETGLSTIGMYGIGMKRAIFKLGTEATVESVSDDGGFAVSYDEKWLKPADDPTEENWDLEVKKIPSKKVKGVAIKVTKLKKEIAHQFGNEGFVNRLKQAISENFGYLMQKGFVVKVNGEKLRAKTLSLLVSSSSSKPAIKPYDYVVEKDGVRIRVTVGFYKPLKKNEDDAEEDRDIVVEGNQAGISVICNDRLVLINDRTMKTGWGDGGVPQYHPQFRSISGFIIFTTDDPYKLPISTTKRDLDVGADLYLHARQYCMEGLREFVAFTNKWKGMEEETNKYFEETKRKDARTEVRLAEDHGFAVRGNAGAKKYATNLPMPEVKDPMRRISFAKKDAAIRQVSKYLFNDSDESPATVGQECFDRILKKALGK